MQKKKKNTKGNQKKYNMNKIITSPKRQELHLKNQTEIEELKSTTATF